MYNDIHVDQEDNGVKDIDSVLEKKLKIICKRKAWPHNNCVCRSKEDQLYVVETLILRNLLSSVEFAKYGCY
uniref:Uncharacterized protein n=1 Tax=Romanomermis culicivorax TaxID=13658 RepID=A0A915KEF0_ROMCU